MKPDRFFTFVKTTLNFKRFFNLQSSIFNFPRPLTSDLWPLTFSFVIFHFQGLADDFGDLRDDQRLR